MQNDQESGAKFDQWGIVEVMGHKKFAGHITEQVLAGSALVRVDVPEVTVVNVRTRWDSATDGYVDDRETKTVGAFTKLIGVGSIYCITPTTEEVARKCAIELARYDSNPIPVALPPERQLPAGQPAEDATAVVVGRADDEDDDDDDDYPF